MAIRFGKASIARAAGKNPELRNSLTLSDQRLTALERATSHLAANPTGQSPAVTIPPSSRLGVTTGGVGTGQFQVNITLPHLIKPAAGRSRNQSMAPIYHQVDYATSPDFRNGLTSLQPSTQTFFPISAPPNTKLYIRLRSSFDGKTWGAYIRSGLVAA